MKVLVYISHPSGGLEENTKDVERCIRFMYQNKFIRRECCLVSPIHNFGFMYNDEWLSYEEGLNLCLDLLRHCTFMICIGDYESSIGCKEEIKFCNENNKDIIFIKDYDYLVNNIEKIMEYINIILS